MSKRIGKYNISNKESTLSLADGGEISGAISLSGKTGLQGTAVSAATSIPVAVGTTDLSVTLPAGSLIKDIGFVCTSAIGGTGASGTMTVSAGSAAGGAQFLAEAVICDTNSATAAGSSMSALNAVEADASGAAFADLKDAAALYTSAAQTVYMRFEQKVGVAAAIGEAILYVDYIIVS